VVHDIFSPIADKQMAKTCSEVFTGDYHFIQKDADAAQLGRGQDILTNPDVELLTAQVTYVEESPSGNGLWAPIKFATFMPALLKFATFMPALPSRAQMVDSYEASVGVFQSLASSTSITSVMSSIPIFAEGGWPSVRDWHAGEVATTGRSLLTAHFLGRVASDQDALVSTIVYPAQIRQKLRLLARNMFIDTLGEHPPDFQATIRETLLDNESLYDTLGNIAACQQLLSVQRFNDVIEPHVK
jgi:hypothetical protein